MSLAKFHLRMAGTGTAEVLSINGVDCRSQIKAVQYNGAAHDVGRLIVEMITDDVELEGEGIVYVHRDTSSMLEFLTNLDTQALEQEVVRRMEWGSSSVEETVNLLKEWLGGQTQT